LVGGVGVVVADIMDIMVVLGDTMALLGDTMALLEDTMALLEDIMALLEDEDDSVAYLGLKLKIGAVDVKEEKRSK
jgi:hypothetical protein